MISTDPASETQRSMGSSGQAVVKTLMGLFALGILALVTDTTGPFEGWIQRATDRFSEAGKSPPSPAPLAEPATPQTDPSRSEERQGYTASTFYEPSHTKTPTYLVPILIEFKDWMEMQQKRIGGTLADSLSVQRKRGHIILYLQVNPRFLEQSQDLQLQLAEGVWQCWAERVVADQLAPHRGAAHVVFLSPERKVIGGSKSLAANKIWMTERTGGAQ